jgi:phage baseplate assembly protein W
MPENVNVTNNPSVRHINEDEDSFFGCTFPLTYKGDNVGFFPRAQTVKEQAFSNIKNLLLTQKGERVGQPNFGSNLPSLLFEQVGEDLADGIEEAIHEALETWLPYIKAQNVFVVQDKQNPNQVVVTLEFVVTVDDPDSPETITFNFNSGG